MLVVMVPIRIYSHSRSNPMSVTDYSGAAPEDISDQYSNLSRASGRRRITAHLAVYSDADGGTTEATWCDGSQEGLRDLGDLVNTYCDDLGRAPSDPRSFAKAAESSAGATKEAGS